MTTSDKKNLLVMKLLHYFITEKNYNPVIVHGIDNEIWLENMDSEFRIVRIVMGYIHNKEQYDYDVLKTKHIAKQLKRKLLDFSMNVLSIYLDKNFYTKEIDNFDDKYPDANMLMQMLLLGFRVREIPAVMHMRTEGISMHSGLKPILYMFRMTFSILAVWIREKILKMDEDKIHELEKYDE